MKETNGQKTKTNKKHKPTIVPELKPEFRSMNIWRLTTVSWLQCYVLGMKKQPRDGALLSRCLTQV